MKFINLVFLVALIACFNVITAIKVKYNDTYYCCCPSDSPGLSPTFRWKQYTSTCRTMGACDGPSRIC
jgi:hypothetical protein